MYFEHEGVFYKELTMHMQSTVVIQNRKNGTCLLNRPSSGRLRLIQPRIFRTRTTLQNIREMSWYLSKLLIMTTIRIGLQTIIFTTKCSFAPFLLCRLSLRSSRKFSLR